MARQKREEPLSSSSACLSSGSNPASAVRQGDEEEEDEEEDNAPSADPVLWLVPVGVEEAGGAMDLSRREEGWRDGGRGN